MAAGAERVARILARAHQDGAKEEAQNFIAIQSSYKDVQVEIAAQIKDWVQSANEAVLKDHTAFDEETSLHFDPEGQQRWLERVEALLLETTPENRDD